MLENHIGDAYEQIGSQSNHESNDRLRELASQLARRDNVVDEQPYAACLFRLATVYGRMPSHIANTTVASLDLLGRYGVSITLLELLEDMVRAQPEQTANKFHAYSQVLCMYVFLRQEGKNRDIACADLVRQLSRPARAMG